MKRIYISITFITLFILLIPTSLVFAVPSNFIQTPIASVAGVKLYKSTDSMHFVQEIDLSVGAKIKILEYLPKEKEPCFPNPQEDSCVCSITPDFPREILNIYWNDIRSSFKNAFSVTNGTFFDTNRVGNSPIAFSLKVDDIIKTCGYDANYPNDMLLFELFENGTAQITEASISRTRIKQSDATDIVGGLSPDTNYPGYNVAKERTFLGIIGNDTILILNSKRSTQSGAKEILKEFGAPENQIMMLDGGGSTQMIYQGKQGISSTRTIPQALAVIASEVETYEQYQLSWTKSYDSGQNDQANAVAVDAQNNIIVVGVVKEGGDYEAFVAQYDPQGNQIWVRTYPGANAYDVAIDIEQNIVVVANITQAGYKDGMLIKYSNDGQLLWAQSYDYGGKNNSFSGVGIDSSNNILTSGTFNDSGIRYDDDYYTSKFDQDGNIIWQRTYATGGHDQARGGVAVDHEDNVITAGMSPYYGLHAVKYDSNGNFLWQYGYHTGHYGDAKGVTVDSAGNIYLTGYYHSDVLDACGNATHLYRTMKLDPNGNKLWHKDFGRGCGAVALDVTVDPAGNIVVLGGARAPNETDGKSTIVIYDPDGNKIYQMVDIDNGNYARNEIVFDDQRNFYTVGYTSGSKDILLVKYSISHQLSDLRWPLKGALNDISITLEFGEDWSFGECPPGVQKKHAGLDVSAYVDEMLYASENGVVKVAKLDSSWGGYVTVEHSSSNPNFTTTYWHVIPSVSVGDLVTKGQQIGTIADLGNNTHFHFGLRMGSYSNTSNRGALPKNNCDGDPAFPENFINPETIDFQYFTFSDVPQGYWAERAIYKIFKSGITKGCSQNPLLYCPNGPVTRAEMAVFLGRGIHGSSFTPPPATGIFNDVPKNYWAAAWIEQFYKDGITGGCGTSPLRYCPTNPVTRAQMAIFLLRAKHGKNYTPPPAEGIFNDVPVTYWAADWIEQLSKEGITSGCSTNPPRYCPEASVTRAQMAVFIVRTFGL
jgi:murein DD-endopeptidase MepM/ murein hydrolase activator NlpD